MKISVITPSYNQAAFLRDNLESVRRQKHGDYEHIIVDPGSTDGSTEIALTFGDLIVINEKDRGQSDGINKGFSKSTGDILTWLNSDDFYPTPETLSLIAEQFENNPDIDVIYGDVNFVDERGAFLRKGFVNTKSEDLLESFEYQVGIVQPGVFWRRRVLEQVGGPSEEFEYCMDYELWVRFASKGYKWKYIPKVLAHHRWWGGMKTSSRRDLSLREHFKVCHRYFGYVHWKWIDRYADYLCTHQDGVVNHSSDIDPNEKLEAINKAIHEIVTQESFNVLRKSTLSHMTETLEYVLKNNPHFKQIFFDGIDLSITKESSTDPDAEKRPAWNIFDVTTSSGELFNAYHVPGNFDRYFDKHWVDSQAQRTTDFLESHRTKNKRGDTCIIVGNGPSLKKSDLSLLSGHDVIVSNFAIMSKELSEYATFVTIVNDLVAKQGAIEFNSLKAFKIVPFWLGNYINADETTYFVKATVKPEFGHDFVNDASWRSTVSFFNMQLAFAAGYKKVILIGFDHSYIQPKDSVEGTVISQTEDDDNHFDPRYFKGKDWQAADTNNMEKMYVIARSAYEADGREIVNCTAGGKLEVFRRGDLAEELGRTLDTRYRKISEVRLPKILLIDSTPFEHQSATGQLKSTLFQNWKRDQILHIFGGDSSNGHIFVDPSNSDTRSPNTHRPSSATEIEDLCNDFSPDLIYFRPISSKELLKVAAHLCSITDVPLVIHMMDDWPSHIQLTKPHQFAEMDRALRSLIKRASKLLCIGADMASVYTQRYGGEWIPIANFIDPASFPSKDWQKRPPVSKNCPFVIRYMGALAENMTFSSVKDVATAVSKIHHRLPVKLEIYTMDWCRPKAEREFGNLPGVSILSLVPKEDYPELLSNADATLIAYNFDPTSISYVGFSIANKMPECLASGAPLIAYGPLEVATIAYLKRNETGAEVLCEQDPTKLMQLLERLIQDTALCKKAGETSRLFAEANLSKQAVLPRFQEALLSALHLESIGRPVIGPFQREDHCHFDETDVVAEIFKEQKRISTMIDVGAHHGWALTPFLDQAWDIFAFEPDESNRKILIDRLSKHKLGGRVSLDIRCVGNKSREGVPFFRSEQSTGISGLSAFHESHVESQKVDIVSLQEFFQDKQLEEVGFLKIDTEGHDLFVLQGFPWERSHPDVIECEFEDTKTVPLGYTYHDLAQFLVDKGYTVYVSEWHPIVRYGVRHDWNRMTRYPCQLSDPKGWGNLLAFKQLVDETTLARIVGSLLKSTPETKTPAKVADASSAKATSAPPSTHGPASTKSKASPAPKLRTLGRIKQRLRAAYLNTGESLRHKSPSLFRLGQLVMWSLRLCRRRLALATLFALLIAALIAAPWVSSETFAYRSTLWLSATLLTIFSLGGLSALYIRHRLVLAIKELGERQQRHRSEYLQRLRRLEAQHKEASEWAKTSIGKFERISLQVNELAGHIAGFSKKMESLPILQEQLEASSLKFGNELQGIGKRLTDTGTHIEGLKARVAEQESFSTHLDQARSSLSQSIEELKQQTAKMSLAPVFNYGDYQPFSRKLSPSSIKVLLDTWAPRLQLNTTRKSLSYLAHRICMIEGNSRGRLASTIDAAVLRALIPTAIHGKKVHILEIGTLFGVGLAAMYDHAKPRFDKVHITAIDPLDGYYGKDVRDLITNEPVSEEMLRENLSRTGIPPEDFTLIKRLSTDSESIDAALETPCDVLVIDGDHSYEGVKADFENYLRCVNVGGFILFDDYESADWPGVTEFVNREVMSRPEVELVGSGMRTALFRVKHRELG